MPEHYTPTAEHLAELGYTPDSEHSVPAAGLVGYSRRERWPRHPFYATLVVQVRPADGGVFLDCHAKTLVHHWPGWLVPTPLFFEQLLQAVGWPVKPPLPRASAQLMLLRWIANQPERAYQLLIFDELPALRWLHEQGLITRSEPVPPHLRGPGLRGYEIRARPGMIEPTGAGLDYLHKYRGHRETPENLPAIITQTTNEHP